MAQREKNIPVQWVSGIKDKKEKDEFKNKVASAAEVLLVLKNICSKKIKHTTNKDFENAAWPYERAYQDGFNEALREIQKLLP